MKTRLLSGNIQSHVNVIIFVTSVSTHVTSDAIFRFYVYIECGVDLMNIGYNSQSAADTGFWRDIDKVDHGLPV